jgi:hypothetical protein
VRHEVGAGVGADAGIKLVAGASGARSGQRRARRAALRRGKKIENRKVEKITLTKEYAF